MLVAPSRAAEYQGETIDGRKLAAKIYSHETGAVYEAQVQFDRDQAEIIFAGGGRLRLKLRQSKITNLAQIEGYGRLGHVPLGQVFSIGLNQRRSGDDLAFGRPHSLQDFWSIRLNAADFPPDPVQR
ncbi:MAG TPA: hypothetical protein V6D18_01520 [Thermosynechococcaceae cyanobacterium]